MGPWVVKEGGVSQCWGHVVKMRLGVCHEAGLSWGAGNKAPAIFTLGVKSPGQERKPWRRARAERRAGRTRLIIPSRLSGMPQSVDRGMARDESL